MSTAWQRMQDEAERDREFLTELHRTLVDNWFRQQAAEPWAYLALWYLRSGEGTYGEVRVSSERPGPTWERSGHAIPRGADRERAAHIIREQLRKLPILAY